METKSDLWAIRIQEIKARAAESVRSARYAPLKLYECSVQAIVVVWASGTVCISLYKTVPSAHKKVNFLLGSRRTGARKEGFLAGGGARKTRHFLRKLSWPDPIPNCYPHWRRDPQGATSSAAATSSGMTDSKMHSARPSASAGAAVHSRERGPEVAQQRPSTGDVAV